MRLAQAIFHIAQSVDNNLGWHAATQFHRQGVLDDRQYKMLTEFEQREGAGVTLTQRQQNARGQINARVLNGFTALDILGLDINTEEVTVARNGWKYDYQPVF